MPAQRRGAAVPPAEASEATPRVLKKYPNRRLYDTRSSAYITLADVKEMVLQQEDFEVRDAKSGDDLTRAILLQIILEDEEDGHVRKTVLRRARDAVDAGDAGHRLLHAVEHFTLHHVGRRSRIRDGDVDDRLLHVGELVGLELPQREEPEDNQCHHRHDGDQWLLDGEI